MKLAEQIAYLKEHYAAAWSEKRSEIADAMRDEANDKRFDKKVDYATAKRMSKYLPR